MFKGKKGVYILIPLNVLIWGFFIYRFYTAYHEYDETPVTEKSQEIKLDEVKDSITYKLKLDYKDPFLREGEKTKTYAVTYEEPSKTKIDKPVKPVKTPTVESVKPPAEIKYFGMVKNSGSGVSTGLISFNGQSRIIKPNDVIDGIVFKTFDNSELIAFSGKEKIIVRKQ